MRPSKYIRIFEPVICFPRILLRVRHHRTTQRSYASPSTASIYKKHGWCTYCDRWEVL